MEFDVRTVVYVIGLFIIGLAMNWAFNESTNIDVDEILGNKKSKETK